MGASAVLPLGPGTLDVTLTENKKAVKISRSDPLAFSWFGQTSQYLSEECRKSHLLARPHEETARSSPDATQRLHFPSSVSTITRALPALGKRAATSEGTSRTLEPFNSVVNSTAFIGAGYCSDSAGSIHPFARPPSARHARSGRNGRTMGAAGPGEWR